MTVEDDAEAAARSAATRLAGAAARGAHIALSGGSTPARAYELAAALEPDWSRAEVWWADERCVRPGDPRSNYLLARRALLDRLARTPKAVRRVPGELGAERAAARYDAELDGVRLGLVLLGVGSDGHTASLFPHDATLGELERRAAPVARPDVERVTMTPAVLCAADEVVFLVVGAEKADAVHRAFAQPASEATPASLIRSQRGTTEAILDRAAAQLAASR